MERKDQSLQDALSRYRDRPHERRVEVQSEVQSYSRLPRSLAVTVLDSPTCSVATRRSAESTGLLKYRDPLSGTILATVA